LTPIFSPDKGKARKLIEFGRVQNPEGIRTIGEFPNLTRAMGKAGWAEEKIRKIMGTNWVRILKEVWGQ
jgi:membrane dipeptidase